MKSRSLAMLSIAILIPIALGATYAVGTSGDSDRVSVANLEAPRTTESMKAAVERIEAAHRIARAKCNHLGPVERGNCRTEARAEAKRALKVAQEVSPPS